MANPFFSGRIPQELHNRTEEYLKSTDISKTQLLVRALETYLRSPDNGDNGDNKVITDQLEDRLSEIEKRLKALEGNVITSYQIDNKGEWLTTGEAYEEAQLRGYSKSIGTFRRSLSNGEVPGDLTKLGLTADFRVREQGNPKDNSVRWLKVNP